MNSRKSAAAMSIAMAIFGTIGVVRRFIPLPSGFIACVRGFVGAAVILAFMLLTKKMPDKDAIRKNAKILALSGALIGFNWILLFEAYQYTSVAVATLCYYMAPVFVILASPVLLHEKLTVKKAVCVAAALAGMVLVSGVPGNAAASLRGILLGLGAAALYASVILLNKKLHDITALDRTLVQLAAAAIVIVPYVCTVEKLAPAAFTPLCVVMLIVAGVVHTGLAYVMYFGSMEKLAAQTIAILGYIDPVVAVLLSATVLSEHVGAAELVGAAVIVLALLASELPSKAENL